MRAMLGKFFALIVVLGLALYFVVFPIIGLVTGHLILLSRHSSDHVIEGSWARIISAGFLLLDAFIVYRLWRMSRRSRLVADTLPIWQRNEPD